jgi:hypothetical protein
MFIVRLEKRKGCKDLFDLFIFVVLKFEATGITIFLAFLDAVLVTETVKFQPLSEEQPK